MAKRLSTVLVVLIAILAMTAIPANAAMGGLLAPWQYRGNHSCKHHQNGKHYKCGIHKHRATEPAKPLESVPFAAEEMEVFQIADTITKAYTPPTPYIVGAASAYFPANDEIVIRFLAEYGSFQSEIGGGGNSKYGSSPYFYSKYILPPEGSMPADGYDTAWMVIMDRTKHTYVESEHVRFNIQQPENVRHPVG